MPSKCAEVGIDVDREPVEADPAAQLDPDGGDLVLARRAVGAGRLVGPHHPDADPAGAALAGHVEVGEGGDHPILERGDEAAHVATAGIEVEHDIDDPLAGPVVGVLSATAGDMDRKAAGVGQILGPGRGAGGVERRMFEQPDRLVGLVGQRFAPPAPPSPSRRSDRAHSLASDATRPSCPPPAAAFGPRFRPWTAVFGNLPPARIADHATLGPDWIRTSWGEM